MEALYRLSYSSVERPDDSNGPAGAGRPATMEPMRAIAPLLVALSVLVGACGSPVAVSSTGSPQPMVASPPADRVIFTGPGVAPRARLNVWIAKTDPERAAGLMYVATLNEGQGMTFRYPTPTTGTFWMEHTLIPLSIAFVDRGGSVVDVQEMTPCTTDPCPTYGPGSPYTTAVEANAGWFAANGVGQGDTMTWG